MKTIGLIGGMSWESSTKYYRLLNEETRARRGGHHNAPTIMYTVDFATIERMQREGDWDATAKILADAAVSLQAAGAELLLLCTNTMHLVADQIESSVDIEFVHIIDAVSDRLKAAGHDRVALLATRYTMEHDFYAERMRGHGVTVVVPAEPDRTKVHDIIYRELTQGIVTDASRADYTRVIETLAETEKVTAVVLGCTEIGLLIGEADSPVPVFDSTRIHVEAALEAAGRP